MPDGCELKCVTVMEGDRHSHVEHLRTEPAIHVEAFVEPAFGDIEARRGLRIWYWAYLEDIDAS